MDEHEEARVDEWEGLFLEYTFLSHFGTSYVSFPSPSEWHCCLNHASIDLICGWRTFWCSTQVNFEGILICSKRFCAFCTTKIVVAGPLRPNKLHSILFIGFLHKLIIFQPINYHALKHFFFLIKIIIIRKSSLFINLVYSHNNYIKSSFRLRIQYSVRKINSYY